MATNHNPTAIPDPLATAAAGLSPDDRILLQLLFHEAASSLSQIAEILGIDLLELTARILAEPFQAALAAIEQGAAAVARARALVNGATAVNALTAAATPENPSFAERRRAGAALLRFAPPQLAAPAAPATPAAIPAAAPAPASTQVASSPHADPTPSPKSAPEAPPSPPGTPVSTPPPETFPISSTASAQPTTPARNARDRPAAAVA